MKTITLRLEENMHKDLKIKTFIEGVTMQDKLIELIEDYLKKESEVKKC